MWASTPGIRSASQRPWSGGTIRSWTPCQSSTGTRMSLSSKPHGRVKARSSSRQPATPGASARAVSSWKILRELSGHHRLVGRREERREHLANLLGARVEQFGRIPFEVRLEHLGALQRRRPLGAVLLALARRASRSLRLPTASATQSRTGRRSDPAGARRARASVGHRRSRPRWRSGRARGDRARRRCRPRRQRRRVPDSASSRRSRRGRSRSA